MYDMAGAPWSTSSLSLSRSCLLLVDSLRHIRKVVSCSVHDAVQNHVLLLLAQSWWDVGQRESFIIDFVEGALFVAR
jgi:hypothetical protein